MIVLNFGEYGIHCQSFTRVVKNNDILFTTFDYQSWDQNVDTNNDEWYYLEKFKDEIIDGTVIDIKISEINDLLICLNNGIKIEAYISNGYNHYEEEQEQWRLLTDITNDGTHFVVYNKHIECN